MKKGVLFFCVLAFLLMSFAQSATACPLPMGPTDLGFKGNFYFDLNGTYYVYGVGYPINVLSHLGVFDNEGVKLGDLTLQGQKNYPCGEWDGTYFGHWAFHPEGDPNHISEIGIFPNLSQYQEQGMDMIRLTLPDFNKALGLPSALPEIIGPVVGGYFEGTPIPIPSSLLLLGSGLIGILVLKRRSR